MSRKYGPWPANATIGQLYNDAMKVETVEDATEYKEALVDHLRTHFGKSSEEAAEMVGVNIGYYAAYFDAETRERVYRLYGTEHPVFGTKEIETAEDVKRAIERGKEEAKKSLQ